MIDLQDNGAALRGIFEAVMAKYDSLAKVPSITMKEKDEARVRMIRDILAVASEIVSRGDITELPRAFGKAAQSQYGINTENGPEEFMHASMAAMNESQRIDAVLALVHGKKMNVSDAVDQVYKEFIRADLGYDV